MREFIFAHCSWQMRSLLVHFLQPFGPRTPLVAPNLEPSKGDVTRIRAHRHRTHQLTDLGFWSLEKWGKWGKWRKMGETGEKWRKMGGKWGISGHSTRVCGLWRDVVEESGRNIGEKRDEKPISHCPISPFFRRSKILPTVPFVKISLPHSRTEKWYFLPLTDTHRHGG